MKKHIWTTSPFHRDELNNCRIEFALARDSGLLGRGTLKSWPNKSGQQRIDIEVWTGDAQTMNGVILHLTQEEVNRLKRQGDSFYLTSD